MDQLRIFCAGGEIQYRSELKCLFTDEAKENIENMRRKYGIVCLFVPLNFAALCGKNRE